MTEFHFSSQCPHCHQARTQYGYEMAQLTELLQAGDRIGAQCAVCSNEWSISTDERVAIARALAVGYLLKPP